MKDHSVIKKITYGFVVQEFDPKTKKFVHQEFIAGDQVEYENADGESVDEFSEYLPFDMVQPKKSKARKKGK